MFGIVGRDTENMFGIVGRDTDNLNTAPKQGWNRSGNDRRELSTTRQPPVETGKRLLTIHYQ